MDAFRNTYYMTDRMKWEISTVSIICVYIHNFILFLEEMDVWRPLIFHLEMGSAVFHTIFEKENSEVWKVSCREIQVLAIFHFCDEYLNSHCYPF